jgi:hypothetical protein
MIDDDECRVYLIRILVNTAFSSSFFFEKFLIILVTAFALTILPIEKKMRRRTHHRRKWIENVTAQFLICFTTFKAHIIFVCYQSTNERYTASHFLHSSVG